MNTKVIRISGARQHNLKNLTLDIPRDQLVVVCGPSGSGKSTLAFDIVYAEGQRRYVESLSAYARQFLPQMSKIQFSLPGSNFSGRGIKYKFNIIIRFHLIFMKPVFKPKPKAGLKRQNTFILSHII